MRKGHELIKSTAWWILFGTWAVTLFAPGQPGITSLKRVLGGADSFYLQHFGWESLRRESSVLEGSPDSTSIVAFTDYQCPFCYQAESILDSLRAREPSIVIGYRFVSSPRHPISRDAAIVALCAEAVGVLPEVHESLFRLASLDSSASFTDLFDRFATEDLPTDAKTAVVACSRAPTPTVLRRLSKDSSLANRMRLQGTPTFVGPGGSTVGVPALSALYEIAGVSNVRRRDRKPGVDREVSRQANPLRRP